MAFLNPLFLFGLFAAAIPLLIHLWSRRQAVTVDFSSLMFLVAAHRQNVRRIQLKQLLILLLRMLIIALIALALARPFLTLGLPIAAVRAKTDVVIVLDNSYSMGYQDVDGVWFEKAKTFATDVLGSLRHGDSASLILMSDISQPVFRQLTPDVEDVIETIQDAKISYRDTNVQPSIELAHQILSESTQQNKELYVISDFAQNGWNNWGQIPNQSGSRIFLLSVSENSPHNTNIEEILPSHQLIGVDLPFHLNVKINNHSEAPLAQTTLSMYVEDQKRKTQTFSATTNESIVTTITHNFLTPGIHTGYFELTDDRLSMDNRRYFAFDALGEIQVLCVSEETEYLTLVLNPLQTLQMANAPVKNAMIQPTACTPVEFEEFPLQGFDIVLLADVQTISKRAEVQLREFIRQGKSVIAFVSHNYNFSWAPARFGERMIWRTPQRVNKYDESHPIFDIFHEKVLSGQYGPQFYQGLTVTPASDATVIAHFEDATPFLIERREGKSRLLFFNSGLHQQSNNSELLVNPYFLPLLQNTVLYAVHDDTQKNINVGESFTANYPDSAGAPAWVKRLESADAGAAIAVPIEDDGAMRFESTELPGIYQVEIKAQGRLSRDFFAVNTSSSEANLASIPLEQAAKRVNAQSGSINEIGELDTEALDIKRHGREIWGELLILAICLLLLEVYLSNRESTLTTSEA